jgi:hypothetical protein
MNTDRPALDAHLEADTFRRFYYLKEELIRFCRQNGLAASGSKEALADRVDRYLRTGLPDRTPAARRTQPRPRRALRPDSEPALGAALGEGFKCTEARRAFFESIVGPRFHFGVKFQRYLRSNPDATYADAIEEWRRLEMRTEVAELIDPQFEYNRYIRDFFSANPGRTLRDAIACWRFRRSLPGSRGYDPSDLAVLGE